MKRKFKYVLYYRKSGDRKDTVRVYTVEAHSAEDAKFMIQSYWFHKGVPARTYTILRANKISPIYDLETRKEEGR